MIIFFRLPFTQLPGMFIDTDDDDNTCLANFSYQVESSHREIKFAETILRFCAKLQIS